jgi:uncharacterized membrane protein HdeD (DUF308 family)
MHLKLAKNWWSLLLRGLVAIAFAVITVASPGITLSALVLLFGAYALVDGVLSIVGAVRAARAHERWGILVLEGLAGIAAFVITMVAPIVTALAMVWLVAPWAIVTGALEMMAAVKLRKLTSHEWLLALGGAASLILEVLLITMPLAGALVLALWIGAYAFVFGFLIIALAFRLRTWMKSSTDSEVLLGNLEQRRAS